SRMAYLDPAWDSGLFEMWDKTLLSNIEDYPVIEWYQTSPYNILFGQEAEGGQFINQLLEAPLYANGNQIYNQAIKNTAYVRSHPLWQPGYPTGGGLLHASARRHYFAAIKDDRQPTVLERFDPLKEFVSTPCPENNLRQDADYSNPYSFANIFDGFELGPPLDIGVACFFPNGSGNGPSAKASVEHLKQWRGYPLSQVRGINTITTNDDGYGIQKFETEYHQDLILEAGDSVAVERCNLAVFKAGFHAKAGSWLSAVTEKNCQSGICPANCVDTFVRNRTAQQEEDTPTHIPMALDRGPRLPLEEAGTFKVYPNPTNDQLTVEWPKGQATLHITLYNMQRVVQLEQVITTTEGLSKACFDLSILPEGLYILTVHDTKGHYLYATRIIKE
ncbi:MAG: T9SS type A sorting domain-containing protein, partial [Bacteroidota bacterium]